MATFGIYPKTQLCWLIGPLILNIGFPLPADVNRALWGGGVPEDRTPTVHREPGLEHKEERKERSHRALQRLPEGI